MTRFNQPPRADGLARPAASRFAALPVLAAVAAVLGGCRFTETGKACAAGVGLTSEGYAGSQLPDGQLALSLDGGPAGTATHALGDYLYGAGIQAAFFVGGQAAAARAGDLQTLKDQGHLVGNHTYSERETWTSGDPVRELRKTDELIAPYVTGNMFLFRSPSSGLSRTLAETLNTAGLGRYVGDVRWDIGATPDCIDAGTDAETCAQDYLDEIRTKRHGIVRLTAAHAETEALLRTVVPKLRDEGFTFVRLDAVPSIRQALEQGGASPGTVGGAGGCDEY